MTRKNTWLIYLIGSLVAVIVLVAVYVVYLVLSTPQPDTIALVPDNQYNGITAIDPPQPMPDFTLIDHLNDPISLSDLRGRPTLITFGFTHCPDICPITLGEIRNIQRDLENVEADIHYVFISVDGERDTPDVLRAYLELQQVESFMVGMTGAPDAVREVGEPYGVDFIYNPADEQGNYNVDHTAGMFLVDSRGNWVRRYAYGMSREQLVANLQVMIANDSDT